MEVKEEQGDTNIKSDIWITHFVCYSESSQAIDSSGGAGGRLVVPPPPIRTAAAANDLDIEIILTLQIRNGF